MTAGDCYDHGMRRTASLLALLALVISSSPAAAKCARSGLRPVVLTPKVEVPADGGGIVVGTEAVSWDQIDEGEAPASRWGFLTKSALGEPTITTLAPGLVVYSVPASLVTTGELTNGKRTVAKLTLTRTKVPLLAAPKVKAATHATSQSFRARTATTTVQLDGDAPATAVALVIADAKTQTPRSWGTVTAGATEVVVYQSRRCSTLPNGTLESAVGDKVVLRWVDNRGRLSAASAPIAIAKAP